MWFRDLKTQYQTLKPEIDQAADLLVKFLGCYGGQRHHFYR